jgi:hypothetical protein
VSFTIHKKPKQNKEQNKEQNKTKQRRMSKFYEHLELNNDCDYEYYGGQGCETSINTKLLSFILILLLIFVIIEMAKMASKFLNLEKLGMSNIKKEGISTTGSAEHKRGGVFSIDNKNVLIVDVANMYVGWYMEKNKTKTKFKTQDLLFKDYIKCISDHYRNFRNVNKNPNDLVEYVIKNHRVSNGTKVVAPSITDDNFRMFEAFVYNHEGANISIAEDYSVHTHKKWTDKSFHYLRASDDFLCFAIAQLYKKQYVNAFIMSADKFKDFDMLSVIPKFNDVLIYAQLVDENKKDRSEPGGKNTKMKEIGLGNDDIIKRCVIRKSVVIIPSRKKLGVLSDYKIAKPSLQFSFSNIKTANIEVEPGHMWDDSI